MVHLAKYENDGGDYFPELKKEQDLEDYLYHLQDTEDGLCFKHMVHIIEQLPKKPIFLHNLKKNNKLNGGKIGTDLIITSKGPLKQKYFIEMNQTALDVWKQKKKGDTINKFEFYTEIAWWELF